MTSSEVVAKVKEILLENEEIKTKWNAIGNIHSISDLVSSAKNLFFIISRAAYLLEYVQKELAVISKEERIEIAAQLLDDLIVFKGWAVVFEPFDKMVFKLVVGQVVTALDNKFGNDWLVNTAAQEELDKYKTLIDTAYSLLNG